MTNPAVPSYLLDTSVIIPLLKNSPRIVSLVQKLEGEISSSSVCLSELYEGIFRTRDSQKNEESLNELFARLSSTYGIDAETARYFGKTRAQLKKLGEVIEDLDILIAATCLAHNLTLVTANPKHFSRVPDLKILPIP